MSLSLIIRNATLPDGRSNIDIAVADKRIADVRPNIDATAEREIDAAGQLVTPPFVDSHFHIDATLSLGMNGEYNQSGTLAEGIALWGRMRGDFDAEAFYRRAMRYCDLAIAQGLLVIRSHIDITDETLVAAEAIAQVKRDVAPWLDLQLVAFPQMGYFCRPNIDATLRRVVELGFEVIGGIPHLEPTYALGQESIRILCEFAAEHGLRVDMHCDENDDPNSRLIHDLTYACKRLGMAGRVTGSHLTSMHSMDNFFAARLITQMADAGVCVIANPLANMHLQGRFDTYPKRRGMTRVPELIAAGCTVALGQDSALDPWYPMGRADMLDVAHMGAHAGHMSTPQGMHDCFHAVTSKAAEIVGVEGYGLEPGCNADLVILQAKGPAEAIRLQPPRLHVIRRGQEIAATAPQVTTVTLGNRQVELDFATAHKPDT